MFEIEYAGKIYKIDPESLMPEEMGQLGLDQCTYVLSAGVEPDAEVKAALVALQVLRRQPQLSTLEIEDIIEWEPVTPIDADDPRMDITDELLAQMAAL